MGRAAGTACMNIEVRDESADLVGHLDVAEAPDARVKCLVIPYLQDGRFCELRLAVERVQMDNRPWMALRANSQVLDVLKRCQKFTAL